MKNQIIIDWPMIKYASFVWFEIAFLPNEEGFKFIGLRTDGVQVLCVVTKDAEGLHVIEGASVKDFISWRNITDRDLQSINPEQTQ